MRVINLQQKAYEKEKGKFLLKELRKTSTEGDIL